MKNTDRHAYLIIAHNDPYVFRTLISLIDDPRNDIYVLVDEKVDPTEFSSVKTNFSKLTFIPRIKIYWGHFSLIQAEVNLFEAAYNQGDYSYFHLISGVDLPLKSQDYIHDLFDRQRAGKEMIGIIPGITESSHFCKRLKYYHLGHHDRSSNHLAERFFAKLNHLIRIFQRFTHTERKIRFEIGFGPNWVSFSKAFTGYMLRNKETYLKRFKYCTCADEFFFQSIFLNSPFREKSNAEEVYASCLRKIDWGRGNPYTWRSEDFDELIGSDAIFARKFNSGQDQEIIQKIAEHLHKQQSSGILKNN